MKSKRNDLLFDELKYDEDYDQWAMTATIGHALEILKMHDAKFALVLEYKKEGNSFNCIHGDMEVEKFCEIVKPKIKEIETKNKEN